MMKKKNYQIPVTEKVVVGDPLMVEVIQYSPTPISVQEGKENDEVVDEDDFPNLPNPFSGHSDNSESK